MTQIRYYDFDDEAAQLLVTGAAFEKVVEILDMFTEEGFVCIEFSDSDISGQIQAFFKKASEEDATNHYFDVISVGNKFYVIGDIMSYSV